MTVGQRKAICGNVWAGQHGQIEIVPQWRGEWDENGYELQKAVSLTLGLEGVFALDLRVSC